MARKVSANDLAKVVGKGLGNGLEQQGIYHNNDTLSKKIHTPHGLFKYLCLCKMSNTHTSITMYSSVPTRVTEVSESSCITSDTILW